MIILLAAFLSFKTTNEEVRIRNHFTWGAILEVAVLFIGIFITMQPALMILKANGAELGISKPFQMFWATGALSSFLDNTPTYLVFLTTAGALGFKGGVATTLGAVPVLMLEASSCGAVFMGAITYRKCTDLYGKIYVGCKRCAYAVVLRIYGMVTDIFDTGIYYRYVDILFIEGGAEYAGE